MASDMSARPHEILNLKIKDISFKQGEEGIQYAEVFVAGKTKSRTLPLIFSIPYVKDWLQDVHKIRALFDSYAYICRYDLLLYYWI